MLLIAGKCLSRKNTHQTASEVISALDHLTQANRLSGSVRVESISTGDKTEHVWEEIDRAETRTKADPRKSARRRWVLAGVLAFLALSLLAVVTIKTPHGTLIIESDDENVEMGVTEVPQGFRLRSLDIHLRVPDVDAPVSPPPTAASGKTLQPRWRHSPLARSASPRLLSRSSAYRLVPFDL